MPYINNGISLDFPDIRNSLFPCYDEKFGLQSIKGLALIRKFTPFIYTYNYYYQLSLNSSIPQEKRKGELKINEYIYQSEKEKAEV